MGGRGVSGDHIGPVAGSPGRGRMAGPWRFREPTYPDCDSVTKFDRVLLVTLRLVWTAVCPCSPARGVPVSARRLLSSLAVPVLAAGLLVLSGSAARAATCVGTAANDFNGDGFTDIAIADP